MSNGPPKILRRLLAWTLPAGRVRDGLLGDLDELYGERVRNGRAGASLWYARQLLSAAVRYLPRRLRARGTHGKGARMLEGLGRDLGDAFRMLRASPGFTVATIVTLALGIGAPLMMHGYGRFARPGPSGLDAPERLVYLGEGPEGCPRCVSMASRSYATVRDHARSFAQVSMFIEWEPALRGAGSGELLDGLLVTPEIFGTLGVRPLLGRFFVPDDGVPGSDQVVVLSEAAWRRRLGGDAGVIGQTVILDRLPYTVVGVAPGDLVFPHAGDATEIWAPIAWTPGMASEETPQYQVVARLRDGTTARAASAEVTSLAPQAVSEAPAGTSGLTFLVNPLIEDVGLNTVPTWLAAAVGLVLLTAWINLAGLLIARLSARRQELAVRRALGAAPSRIVRQLLVEVTLLAALGGLCGVAVAVVAARALLGSAQPLDLQAFGLALALGLISGVAIAVWPAFRFARPRLVHGLADVTRLATGRIDTARGRRALTVAQVALATVLLSAAGLLARSFQNIYRIDAGFNVDRVLALRVWDPPHDPNAEPEAEHVDRLVRALEAVPGVERAGAVLSPPFGFGSPVSSFQIEGLPLLPPTERPRARMQAATPDYFAALGIPLRRGRPFSDADGTDAPRVAIINQAAARRYFSDQDPIGRGIILDGQPWEIVGIVGTVFRGDQEEPAEPEIYRPMRQWARPYVWITLRTRGDPGQLGAEVRTAVRGFDPDIAITRLLSMDALRAGSMESERMMLRLMAGFALAAILISAVGLYGLISYSVSQRTREFGVRLALGAPTAAVVRLVLAQGVRLAAVGAVIGLAGAIAALRVIQSLLFGVSATDPLTLGAVVAGVCGVSLIAAYIPARRATRIDPLTSLRRE